MGRKPKYIFTVHEGTIYVRMNYCGIHPLIVLNGEVGPIVTFKNDKGEAHLEAQKALDWFRRELEEGEKRGYSKAELKRYASNIKAYEMAFETIAKES